MIFAEPEIEKLSNVINDENKNAGYAFSVYCKVFVQGELKITRDMLLHSSVDWFTAL